MYIQDPNIEKKLIFESNGYLQRCHAIFLKKET
jgi:hypothetical protein